MSQSQWTNLSGKKKWIDDTRDCYFAKNVVEGRGQQNPKTPLRHSAIWNFTLFLYFRLFRQRSLFYKTPDLKMTISYKMDHHMPKRCSRLRFRIRFWAFKIFGQPSQILALHTTQPLLYTRNLCLQRNLGLLLLTSFEIASEKAKPVRPVRVRCSWMNGRGVVDGRTDAEEEVVSLCIAKVTAQWILGLAWQWPRLWRDATNSAIGRETSLRSVLAEFSRLPVGLENCPREIF